MEHWDSGTLSRPAEVITMSFNHIIQQVVKIGTQWWRSGIDDIISLIQKVNLKRPNQIHLMCIICRVTCAFIFEMKWIHQWQKEHIFIAYVSTKNACEVYTLAFQIPAQKVFWVGFLGVSNWKPRAMFFRHVPSSQKTPASLASTLASGSHRSPHW